LLARASILWLGDLSILGCDKHSASLVFFLVASSTNWVIKWPRLVLSLALSPSKGQSKGWGVNIYVAVNTKSKADSKVLKPSYSA
jgi:hypothetical protein